MTGLAWQPLAIEDTEGWREARKQAHNALQWLVRMAHSYRPHEPDNAHVLLSFDPARGAFQTGPFLERFTVELRLPALDMQFTEDGRHVPHILYMTERSPAKVEAWILVELLHRGIDRERFSKALPYSVPDLMTGDAVEYAPDLLERELALLSAWLANAALVFEQLAPASAPLTCWPDTFTVGRELKGEVPARIGLTIGEDPTPIFAVTPANGAARRVPLFRLPVDRIMADGLGPADIANQLVAAIPGQAKMKVETR